MIPYYEIQAQEFVDRTINVDMISLYQPFHEALPQIDGCIHILDAACGSGRDTRYFLSKGYKVTAFDSSAALVRLGSVYSGQPVLHMAFEDMTWVEEFDGIWSAACLLHCSRAEIELVMARFIKALKQNGVWYMSFKDGDGESYDVETDRVFNSYTVQSLNELFTRFPSIIPIKVWSNPSLSSDTKPTVWVNALVRKGNAQK
jgi:SAM-dependent methyltransferase